MNKKMRPVAIMTLALLAGCGASTDSGTRDAMQMGSASKSSSAVEASAYTTVVQQLYIAYFGRPADSGGLANFTGRLALANAATTMAGIDAAYKTNATIKELVDAFGTSAESAALYSGGTSAFVTAIYNNVLNRAPDSAGLAYWVNEIDKNGLTRGNAALSIMNGALTNVTTQGVIDGTTVSNKTTVGVAFTTSLVTASQIAGYSGDAAAASARTMLASVTNSTNTTTFQTTINSTIAALVATALPGAPTVGTATAGNASASVAFTAPSATGTSSISSYIASCTAANSTITATGTASPITINGLSNGSAYSCTVAAVNAAGTGTASAAASVTPTNGITTTAALFCGYNASVVNPTYSNVTSTVAFTCSSSQRTINASGVPDHAVGAFPNTGNPNAIKAVTVNTSYSLTPALAASTTAISHKVGYANNGVALDPSTAESYQNAGVWKIEALNQSYFAFGVDSSNAHVQPDGAYHYHGMPEGLVTKQGKGQAMTLVAFAADGFPIYARYGYTTATNASSAIKTITASYRLKSTASTGRPATSVAAMGTFTQDYEYVAGLGDLDECNGRFGVTPEFPSGIYHYYITDGYPYIQRCIKGTGSFNGTMGTNQ
jgi:hypothetical protein